VSDDRPLDDDEIRSLGYEPGPSGWELSDPDRRPPRRPGLCRGCRKFTGHPDWDGLCAGCMYWGEGDPHGLHRSMIRARLRRRLRRRAAGE
jgi:hypothetical protein